MKKKERMNHVICGLPHRKGKEKKADKLSGKQADVTAERFLQFLSTSASNKEERKSERVSLFINDTDNLIFQIIISLLRESRKFNRHY